MRLLYTFALALLLPACEVEPEQDKPSDSQGLTPLSVREHRVVSAEGRPLFEVAALPNDITVEPGRAFAASESITEASVGPDGRWLAVASVGTAHGAGWMVALSDPSRAYPAAFQYGGNVSIGPWSESGRFVVFVHKGPAPSRTLSVVDRDNMGSTVSATAIPVRIDHHAEHDNLHYSPRHWRSEQLHFDAGEHGYVFHPEENRISRDD